MLKTKTEKKKKKDADGEKKKRKKNDASFLVNDSLQQGVAVIYNSLKASLMFHVRG